MKGIVPYQPRREPRTSAAVELTDQGIISNILEENVVQPLLVSTSALELATETVALILRIDDIQVSGTTL